MEINSIMLLLAVLLLVGMYLYAPFSGRKRRAPQLESQAVSALQAERDRVLDSLRELDFDHTLGKVPTEDYPQQRAALVQQGSGILRKLDELAPLSAPARGGQSAAASKLGDDEIEAMIAARRKQRKSKSAGFCPRCGKPVLVSDKFCPSCGKSLT